MARLIAAPSILQSSAGTAPKTVAEFVGRVPIGSQPVSIAVVQSPQGWSEPPHRPQFEEYSIVLDGELAADTEDGQVLVTAGQGLYVAAGELVSYATPGPDGASYVSVCLPALAPAAPATPAAPAAPAAPATPAVS